MKSVLQDWVTSLGLRHQGVLVGAIRGCDTAVKEDPAKKLTRCLRGVILNAFVGDAKKSTSFIEWVSQEELLNRFQAFRKSLDHYPIHYITHLAFAMEIIGYKHPDATIRTTWRMFYFALAKTFHMNPETEEQLDDRLLAPEEKFAQQDADVMHSAHDEAKENRK